EPHANGLAPPGRKPDGRANRTTGGTGDADGAAALANACAADVDAHRGAADTNRSRQARDEAVSSSFLPWEEARMRAWPRGGQEWPRLPHQVTPSPVPSPRGRGTTAPRLIPAAATARRRRCPWRSGRTSRAAPVPGPTRRRCP